MVLVGMLAGCTNSNKQTTNNDMDEKLELTQEWDKVFPLSEKVNHQKVTFKTQYGLTLAADLYTPASPDPSKGKGEKLPAIAVSGPFGAVKEQCSGLYAMKMAERGFVALAFDPSYTGESSGEPRRTASPDINTEDFMAAVDFLSKQDNVDAEKIGIIGICGWGGIALNAAAADTRIKATVASTMYDMTRVISYIVEATVALMRVSAAAALRAIPPHPQMPMIPMRSVSTFSCFDRKSTAAIKSSVLMSGDAVRRGSPLLSPV